MTKSRIQYRGQSNEKWVAVRIPVEDAESDSTRIYEFPYENIDGMLEIDNDWSALLLKNEKQVLVKSPLGQLRKDLRMRGTGSDGVIDLTEVTGLPYPEEKEQHGLSAVFQATLPTVNTEEITPNPDLKITLFAHYRLDENPQAKYCVLTTTWNNINKLTKSGIARNTTCVTLKSAVKSTGIKDRLKWWFDMDPSVFQEKVNLAMMQQLDHLDLSEETRKCVNVPKKTKSHSGGSHITF